MNIDTLSLKNKSQKTTKILYLGTVAWFFFGPKRFGDYTMMVSIVWVVVLIALWVSFRISAAKSRRLTETYELKTGEKDVEYSDSLKKLRILTKILLVGVVIFAIVGLYAFLHLG